MSKRKKLGKRYEVRQDKRGRWGILDKNLAMLIAKGFCIDDEAFAPWDLGRHDPTLIREIVEYAVNLNVGRIERGIFSWEEWEPKP